MKQTIKITSALIILFIITSCVTEDNFGKSNLNQILYFTIDGQTGNTKIVQDSLKMYVTVGSNSDINSLAVDSVKLSSFAKISPSAGELLDLSVPAIFAVTAEDGSVSNYTLFTTQEASTPQLENSNFDDWYIPAGKNYNQPGKDNSSIWASANEGMTTTGSSNYNTSPLLISGNDYAAQLITKDLGVIAQITHQRMGAATLFTGKFVLNIVNPFLSAQFGIPFQAKPTAFSIDYNYRAGTPYKDGSNNVLNKVDSGDIYVLLENRDNPNAIKRIATGWLRVGSSPNTNYENETITMIYGVLPNGTPDYQKPSNGIYGTSSDKVTHISVVFASSADGVNYEGGVNSTLLVNNFKLIY